MSPITCVYHARARIKRHGVIDPIRQMTPLVAINRNDFLTKTGCRKGFLKPMSKSDTHVIRDDAGRYRCAEHATRSEEMTAVVGIVRK